MSNVYWGRVYSYLGAGINWESAGRDYRMLLLKSTGPPTFVGSHNTVAAVLAHANNTECDDPSYARAAIPHATRVAVQDDDVVRATVNTPVSFGALTGETVGAGLIYEHIDGDPANDLAVAFLTSPNFPAVATGSGFSVANGANGFFRARGV